jgi:hypothetical protein
MQIALLFRPTSISANPGWEKSIRTYLPGDAGPSSKYPQVLWVVGQIASLNVLLQAEFLLAEAENIGGTMIGGPQLVTLARKPLNDHSLLIKATGIRHRQVVLVSFAVRCEDKEAARLQHSRQLR